MRTPSDRRVLAIASLAAACALLSQGTAVRAQATPVGVSSRAGSAAPWEASSSSTAAPSTRWWIAGAAVFAGGLLVQMPVAIAYANTVPTAPSLWFPFVPLLGPFVGAPIAAGRAAYGECLPGMPAGPGACSDVRGAFVALFLVAGSIEVVGTSVFIASSVARGSVSSSLSARVGATPTLDGRGVVATVAWRTF